MLRFLINGDIEGTVIDRRLDVSVEFLGTLVLCGLWLEGSRSIWGMEVHYEVEMLVKEIRTVTLCFMTIFVNVF